MCFVVPHQIVVIVCFRLPSETNKKELSEVDDWNLVVLQVASAGTTLQIIQFVEPASQVFPRLAHGDTPSLVVKKFSSE